MPWLQGMSDQRGVDESHPGSAAEDGGVSRGDGGRGSFAAGAAPPPVRQGRLLELWALLVLGLAIRAFAGALAAPPADLSVQPYRVDLNRAGVAELQVLPGLGPARAEAIVLERIRHGRFDGIDDLMRVPGLGQATVAQLLPWLRLAPSESHGPPGGASDASMVDARSSLR